ncbi:leukotoxin LktA family filamentous adhesin [Roseitalea porphyridii]|uniref:leukotoxin LktA family filamentous adhesin n=1 Tax=Roseitalea porphyridii TaxID=1852022 RepID=UPI0013157E96|nr:leukotoxin LktA family filamentous adhesin [Roseitalea porphyridii]
MSGLALAAACHVALGGSALGQSITADGRTATSVTVSGSVTDIRTSTVTAGHGVNTFSSFSVGAGHTANLHVPGGAAGTVNIVDGPRSVLNGAVRSVQGGTVGGDLYFANPNGVVVGPNGSVQAGTVGLSTPSRDFVDTLFGPDGAPREGHVGALVDGTAPQGEADIVVDGRVTGTERVRLRAGRDISISGEVTAGDRAAAMGAAVNTGHVQIEAGRNVTMSGGRVNAVRGEGGGAVTITSSGDITVDGGARILAEGIAGGDGGFAYLFGGEAAYLDAGSTISVSAQGDGDGGFVEFSAEELVRVSGELQAASAGGEAGTIYIDPEIVEIVATDMFSNGARLHIEALERITIGEDIVLSTRQVAAGASHFTAGSTGPSGDLHLEAPVIEVGDGAALLAFADNGFVGGEVLLDARIDDTLDPALALNPVGEARISVTGALLKGRDVTLSATVFKANDIVPNGAVTDYADAITDELGISFIDGLIRGKVNDLDAAFSANVASADIEDAPSYLRASAKIEVAESYLIADRDVTLTADATTRTIIEPDAETISIAFGATDTHAGVIVQDSQTEAGRDVALSATTNETVRLTARSNLDTAAATTLVSNAALAASVRKTSAEAIVSGDLFEFPHPDLGITPTYAALTAGNGISMEAHVIKDIALDAEVATNSEARGLAHAISIDETRATTALGGGAFTGEQGLTMDAETRFDAFASRAVTTATGGPADYSNAAIGPDPEDDYAAMLLNAADTVASLLQVGDLFDDTLAISGAFGSTHHAITTETRFGDYDFQVADVLAGGQRDLGGAYFAPDAAGGAAPLDLTATTDIASLSGETAVRLGDQTNAPRAIAAALTTNLWDVETTALFGSAGSAEYDADLSVDARTHLPAIDRSEADLLAAQTRAGFDLASDVPLVPVDLLVPPMDDVLDGTDTTFLSDVQVAGGTLAVVADRALHDVDITTDAVIEDWAQILSDRSNTLAVTARTDGGLFALRAPSPDWSDATSGGFGAGAAFQTVDVAATTRALVGGFLNVEFGGLLSLDELTVSATNAMVLGAQTRSYGSAEQVGGAGAFALVDYDGTAFAGVDDATALDVGTVTIRARDTSVGFADAAAGSQAGSAGVGVARALVTGSRQATALLTGLDGFAPTGPHVDPWRPDPAAHTVGLLDMDAAMTGLFVAVSDAGAQTAQEAGSESPGPMPDFGNADAAAGASGGTASGGALAGLGFGLALAGDYARVALTDVAEADLNSNRPVGYDTVAIDAVNDTVMFAGAGAAVSGAGTAGLGGAMARIDSDRTTRAAIRNAALFANNPGGVVGEPVDVTATDGTIARVLSSGRGGSTLSLGVIGSVAIVDATSLTEALVEGASVTDTSTVSVDALRTGGALIAAGAIEAIPDGSATPDEEDKKGTAIGLSYARNDTDGTVRANAAFAGPSDAESASITALDDSLTVANAQSRATSSAQAITGAAIVQNTAQTTEALVSTNGGGLTLAGTGALDVTATNEATVRSSIGVEGDGERVGFGAGAIAQTDERTTRAALETAEVTGPFIGARPAITVDAALIGESIAFQTSGAGADGGVAGDLSVSALTTDWVTEAAIDGSDLTYPGAVTLSAFEQASVSNRQGALVDASSGAGTVGLSQTVYGSDVVAEIAGGSTIVLAGGAVTAEAQGDSVIRTRAVRSGEAANAVATVFADQLSTGETRASVDDAEVTATSITIEASDATWREIAASSAATADAVGIAGGLSRDRYQRDTFARSDASTLNTSFGDLAVSAGSDTRATSTALGRANGGDVIGAAALASWIVDDRDVAATVDGGTVSVSGAMAVTADRSDVHLLLQGTTSDSSQSVGFGAGVLLTGGRTEARVADPDTLSVAGDLTIAATEASKAFSVGLGAGTPGAIGGVGSYAYLEMGRLSPLAAARADNERGATERAASAAARAEIMGVFADVSGDASALDVVRDVEILATLRQATGTADIGGDISVTATDDRRGYAVAGQFQAGIVGPAGTFVDRYFEVEDLNASGFAIAIRPFAPASGDADEEDEADLGSEDADSADEFASETAAGSGGGGGWSFGASVARIELGGVTAATVEASAGATVDAGGDVSVEALSTARTAAVSVGAQISTGSNLAGSVALANQKQLVLSQVQGDGTVTGADVHVLSTADASNWSIAGLALVSGDLAIGGTVSVNDTDIETRAEIDGATVQTGPANGLIVDAEDRSRALGVALAGGGGANAFGASVGVASMRGTTEAIVRDATIITGTASAKVRADRDPTLSGFVFQVGIGTSNAAGAAISVAHMGGDTSALAENSTVVSGNDIIVKAGADADLASAAVGIAVGGNLGVTGSTAIATRADTVLAQADDSTLTADDSILVQALGGTLYTTLGGGEETLVGDMLSGTVSASFGGSVGVGVSVALVKAANSVEALVTGTSVLTANGTVADGGVTGIGRSPFSDYRTTFATPYHGIAIVADNQTDISAMAATIAGAGSAAVAAQVPLLFVDDAVRAAVDNVGGRPELASETDVAVLAANETDIETFSLVGSAAGSVGVGADVEYLSLAKTTEASVQGATLDAADDIAIAARSPDALTTVSLAGAAGGAVGIGGIVQVALAETETRARIHDADLIAGGDVFLGGWADRTIDQVVGTLGAGGTVGIGGSVVVFTARDQVIAEVEDAPSAGHAFATGIDADGTVAIEATAGTEHDTTMVGIGAGTVGINATIFVARSEQSVTARLGDHNRVDLGRANALTVTASQAFDQAVGLGSATGGFVGAGATIGAISMSNAVLAEIGDGAAVDVSGDIAVTASGDRSFEGTAVAAGGGAFAFQGSILNLAFGKPTETEETGDHMAAVDDSLENDDPYGDGDDYSGGDAETAAFMADANAGRGTLDLFALSDPDGAQADTIEARIGAEAELDAGDDIDVTALETGDIDVISGGAAGGAAAMTGGVANIRRGSSLIVGIGESATLTAGDDIAIKADATVDTSNPDAVPTAFAASGGLVSGAGAVARVVTERDIDIAIGEAVRLESGDGEDITIRAEETAETRAKALGATFGGVALGGTVAFTRHETDIDIAFEGPTRPVLTGGDVTIVARRDGGVDAEATAAAGGAFAGNGVDTTAEDDARVTIDLGRADFQTAGGTVEIAARNSADVNATSNSVTIGGTGALGFSLATARRSAVSEIVSNGTSSRFDAASVTMLALDTISETSAPATVAATAFSATGGLGTAGGSRADASNTSRAEIDIKLRELDVTGFARFAAATRGDVDAESDGFVLGLAALGANESVADAATTTKVGIELSGSPDVQGDFIAEAYGEDDLHADTRSGQGGLVSLQAARSTIDADPVTEIEITTDGTDDFTLSAEDIEIAASRTVTTQNVGSSLRASLAGYGATKTVTDVDLTTTIAIDDATLEAENVSIIAASAVDKVSKDYDGRIGDVGIVSGTSLKSEVTVDADTDIDLNDATILQRSASTTDGVLIQIANSFDIEDRLKIDTGGGILIPNADSAIEVDNVADIDLDGAAIDAEGDVELIALADADLSNEVHVNVYGLAGRPSGDATTGFDNDQQIDLFGGSAIISRAGDVVLSAGTEDGTGQRIDLSSELRIWNATAFPVTRKPVAEARIAQTASVDVSPTSTVLAAADVSLIAGRGDTDAYAFGASSDLYREGAEAVVNAFGSLVGADEVSFDTVTGTDVDDLFGEIIVDGEVTAGAFAELIVQIDPDGDVVFTRGDAEVTFEDDVDLYANLESYIDELEAQRDAFADDAAIVARLDAEIARIEQIIAGLGASGTADMVIIDDLYASGGNVAIVGTALGGAGVIEARSDVVVEVTNEAPRIVEVRDVTIPFRDAGFVRYNGVEVNDVETVNEINDANATEAVLGVTIPGDGPDAAFELVTNVTNPDDPLVSIQNNFIGTGTDASGDLLVTGTIENLNGTVALSTADGDILVLGGTIDAKTVDIRSGGDFLLSAALDDYITDTGGSPFGIYADFFDEYEAWYIAGAASGPEPVFEPIAGGEIIATGSVFIYANYLNVNGLIQSGITDWDLTIAQNLDTIIDGATFTSDEPVVVYSPGTNSDVNPPLGETVINTDGDTAIMGNVGVRYDPEAHELLVDPILSKGGYVELVGKIISTGGGRIEAADGYGRIDVDSDSDIPLVFTAISTGYGDGASGVIRIVDLSDEGVTPGVFTTTTFEKRPDNTIWRTIDDGSALIVSVPVTDPQFEIAEATSDSAFFGPDDVLARGVTYYLGTSESFTTSLIEQRFEYSDGRPDLITTRSPSTVFGDPVDIRTEQVFVTTADLLAAEPYKYERGFEFAGDKVTTYDGPEVLVAANVFAGIGVTYDLYERPRTDFSVDTEWVTHRLAANYPVDIGFHGYETSELRITHAGDVIFDGPVHNQGGVSVITSENGNIATAGNTVMETALTFMSAGDSIGRAVDTIPKPILGGLAFGGGGGGAGLVSSGRTISGTAPLQIDQLAGRGLEVEATNAIRIAEQAGDMNVRLARSGDLGDVALSAPGSILVHDLADDTGSLVEGGEVSLNATSGSIGLITDPLRVNSTGLDADAGFDINIVHDGTIRADQIISRNGDVNIVAQGDFADIVDVNTASIVDRRATENLLETLWDELGLREGAGSFRDEAAVIRNDALRTAEYFDYWRTRGVTWTEDGDGNRVVQSIQAYDPATELTLTGAERDALVAAGLTDAQIADAEAARTDRYHALHARFGVDAFDPDFEYAAPAEEVAALTEQIFWTDRQLGLGIRADLVLETGDTQLVIEDPNFAGINVNLAAGDDIGAQFDDLVITRGQVLDEATLLQLWTAERGDITVEGDTAFVDQFEDVDVSATGRLIALAGEDLFIGSEDPLALGLVEGGARVRIKGAEGLTGTDTLGLGANVTGMDIVLEGGAGAIGAPLEPVTVEQGVGGTFVARADGDVRVLAPTSNVAVSEIFAGGALVLTAAEGNILDFGRDDATDIVAGSATFLALDDIGRAANPLDVELRDPDGLLSAVSTVGEIALRVPQGNVTVAGVGALDGDVTFRVDQGDLTLANSTAIAAIHADDLLDLDVGGSIVSAPGTGLDLKALTADLYTEADIGTLAEPVVTEFETLDLVAFGLDTDRTAVIANTSPTPGALELGDILFTGAGYRSFTLINQGEVVLGAGTSLEADFVNIAAIGTFDNIEINEALTFTGDTLRLVAPGRIDLADGADVTLFGDGAFITSRLEAVGPLGDAEVDALGDVTIVGEHHIGLERLAAANTTLTMADIGTIEIGAVQTGTLTASTFFGDADFGAVTADSVDIDVYGNVSGTFDVVTSIDLWSSSGLGIDDLDNPSLTILTNDTLEQVQLAGEFGVNLTFEGETPVTLTSVETAMRGDGAFIDADGNEWANLADLIADNPELADIDPLGIGIHLRAPDALLTVAGDGLTSNGAAIDIESEFYRQDAPVDSAGGDIAINATTNGLIASILEAETRSGGGDITLTGTIVQLRGDVRSEGGAITATAGPRFSGLTTLLVGGNIGSGGGDIHLETVGGGDIVQEAGTRIDAGAAGTVRIAGSEDVTITDVRSATLDLDEPAVRVSAEGTLTGLGAGPFISAPSAFGIARIEAGAIANTGPEGFRMYASVIDARVRGGAMHLANGRDAIVARLVNTGGDTIDLVNRGDLRLAGPVTSAGGDVVLTALSDIGGFAGQPIPVTAGRLFLTALDGSMGTPGDPLPLGTGGIGRLIAIATGSVVIDSPDARLDAEGVASATGPVALRSTGTVRVGRLVAPDPVSIVGPGGVTIVQRFDNGTVATLPVGVADLVAPGVYVDLIVADGTAGGGSLVRTPPPAAGGNRNLPQRFPGGFGFDPFTSAGPLAAGGVRVTFGDGIEGIFGDIPEPEDDEEEEEQTLLAN